MTKKLPIDFDKSVKRVIYKEIIIVDGREYTVSTCDYSQSIHDLIKDNILEDDNQEIVNYIIDDVVNLQ